MRFASLRGFEDSPAFAFPGVVGVRVEFCGDDTLNRFRLALIDFECRDDLPEKQMQVLRFAQDDGAYWRFGRIKTEKSDRRCG
jgi:hypothetical protein